jgi:hypothetical protein
MSSPLPPPQPRWYILGIRSGEDEDDRMYPVLSDEAAAYPVELTHADGTKVGSLPVSELSVSQGGSRVTTLRDIAATVMITDCRVIVFCAKYDKGGGWFGLGAGGIATAAVLNTVSKARAARRRRGKLLVGHIRYPWLRAVGAGRKTGWLSDERLRLTVCHKAGGAASRPLALDITLPKRANAALAAQDIAWRAAKFHLAHTEIDPTNRDVYERLVNSPPVVEPGISGWREPQELGFIQIPESYFANPTTAHLGVSTADCPECTGGYPT